MSTVQLIGGITILLLSLIASVRRANIKEKYLSTWIGFLLCPIFGIIFQKPLILLSKELGFRIYSNFIFTIALIWLGLLIFQILIVLSQSEKKIEILAEEIAIMKSKIDNNRKSES